MQVVQEEPLCNDDEFLYSMARRDSCDFGYCLAAKPICMIASWLFESPYSWHVRVSSTAVCSRQYAVLSDYINGNDEMSDSQC